MNRTAEEANARAKRRRAATCRYFTGLQHDTCEAGIAYASVQDGPGCWPCLPPFSDERQCSTTCAHKALYTAEELADRDQRAQDSIVRVVKARGAIVEATGGKGRTAGEIDCPNCGGKLKYTVASNGHIWGACASDGCAQWME